MDINDSYQIVNFAKTIISDKKAAEKLSQADRKTILSALLVLTKENQLVDPSNQESSLVKDFKARINRIDFTAKDSLLQKIGRFFDELMHRIFGFSAPKVLEGLTAYQPITPEQSRNSTGQTPLMLAANNTDPTKIATWFERGAKIDSYSKKGKSALIYAVESGNVEMVKELLRFSPDLNAFYFDEENQQMNPMNALFYAVQTGNKEIVELLLNAGADVNVKNSLGANAIEETILEKKPEMLKVLLPNATADSLASALIAVAESENSEILTLLFKAASPEVYKKAGHSALCKAIEAKNKKFIEKISGFDFSGFSFRKNVDLNKIDSNEQTVLNYVNNNMPEESEMFQAMGATLVIEKGRLQQYTVRISKF